MAEIEHDLGYKAGATVPAPVRRRFSRLAGLLEIADAEFMQIRDGLQAYGATVQEQIALAPGETEIDDVSLLAFVETDPSVRALDEQVAERLDCPLDEDVYGVQSLAAYLTKVGISTIQQLREALQLNAEKVRALSAELGKLPDMTGLSAGRGVSLFHLFQIMIASQNDLAGVSRLLDEFNIALPAERAAHARRILKAAGKPVDE